MFGELNKKRTSVDWGVDNSSYEYRKCSDMAFGTPMRVYGMYITPDKGYGLGAVLIMDGFNLNLPQRYVETIKGILENAEQVAGVIDGHCAIKVSEFTSKKYKRKGYEIEFLDV